MGSVRGWLDGDWPSTGGVLNITAAAWTAASSDGVLATKSERKMLASTCLYSLYAWLRLVINVTRRPASADRTARTATSGGT